MEVHGSPCTDALAFHLNILHLTGLLKSSFGTYYCKWRTSACFGGKGSLSTTPGPGKALWKRGRCWGEADCDILRTSINFRGCQNNSQLIWIWFSEIKDINLKSPTATNTKYFNRKTSLITLNLPCKLSSKPFLLARKNFISCIIKC